MSTPSAHGAKKSMLETIKKFFTENVHKNPDLMLLLVMSGNFLVLDVFNIGEDLLSPFILALMGVLAFSQIRSRDQISEVTASWHRVRTDLFLWDFPDEYKKAQLTATQSYFFAGMTMGRTLPLMTEHIKRILSHNGLVQILLPDPHNERLLEMIAATRPEKSINQIKREIQHSLESLGELRSDVGTLEIRTAQFQPSLGINAIDLESPSRSNRSIMIQMYEFAPKNGYERAPIFFLTIDDHVWFSHFEAQIDRLWNSGNEYSSELE